LWRKESHKCVLTNTREHYLLWKKKKRLRAQSLWKISQVTLGVERERGLGFGAQVLVCSSVLAASCLSPAICIAGAAEDGAEDR